MMIGQTVSYIGKVVRTLWRLQEGMFGVLFCLLFWILLYAFVVHGMTGRDPAPERLFNIHLPSDGVNAQGMRR